MFWILLLPLLLHPGYACMRPAPPASVTNPSTTAPPAPPAPAPSSSGTNVDVSSEPANRNETTGGYIRLIKRKKGCVLFAVD